MTAGSAESTAPPADLDHILSAEVCPALRKRAGPEAERTGSGLGVTEFRTGRAIKQGPAVPGEDPLATSVLYQSHVRGAPFGPSHTAETLNPPPNIPAYMKARLSHANVFNGCWKDHRSLVYFASGAIWGLDLKRIGRQFMSFSRACWGSAILGTVYLKT